MTAPVVVVAASAQDWCVVCRTAGAVTWDYLAPGLAPEPIRCPHCGPAQLPLLPLPHRTDTPRRAS